MKKVEEPMPKGHIQNKQRILKKVCARQVPSPSLSVSTEHGEAGKILFVLIFKWTHKLKESMN